VKQVGAGGERLFESGELSLSAQFTSSRVLLCWLWFFLGIVVAFAHERGAGAGGDWRPAWWARDGFQALVMLRWR
jgi:hypothetical protein